MPERDGPVDGREDFVLGREDGGREGLGAGREEGGLEGLGAGRDLEGIFIEADTTRASDDPGPAR